MAISIVLMSACPNNLFNPILYLLPKLKRYSGRKPPRPVYVKALYLQQQRPCFIVGEIALLLKAVLIRDPTKTVAVDQPHLTCLY